jgi:hypothetical protein
VIRRGRVEQLGPAEHVGAPASEPVLLRIGLEDSAAAARFACGLAPRK